MAIKWKHSDEYSFYFCTFTCFEWLPLIEITNSYDLVYRWFNILNRMQYQTVAFVIMPNHLHVIFYFPETGFSLNDIISNGKRFMAYEMIHRLQVKRQLNLLKQLSDPLTSRERGKSQQHRIFEHSFDAKAIYTDIFFYQKIDYIHHNPVNGKWNLAKDFTEYEHSSAAYYERSVAGYFVPFDYRLL